jgi:hypothetical protein
MNVEFERHDDRLVLGEVCLHARGSRLTWHLETLTATWAPP